jgi:integrase
MSPRLIGGPHNARVARRRRRRGEGSVYRDGRSWIARWPLGVVDGKRKSERHRFPNEADAKAELERMRRAYAFRGHPTDITVREYLADWLRHHRRGLRPATSVMYEGNIRRNIVPLIGGIPLARLQPADVRRLMDDAESRGLSAASVVRFVTILRIALKAAMGERLIGDNPASHVRLPRIQNPPIPAMRPVEADAIVDATAGTWVGPIVRLLLGSGIRLGEAIGLDQGDLLLDEHYIRIRISKTMERAVPISDDAAAALREALALAPRRGPDEPVFYSPHKPRNRMVGTSVSSALPRILRAAGLPPLSPHKLRHGAATLMLQAGIPLRVISEQLGHRNPALTSRLYAHVTPDMQRDAVRSLERRTGR